MKYKEYVEIVMSQMTQQMEEEHENIQKAAEICKETVMNERVIHVFGCGHSQMFPMEVFYRAGGLAQVDALIAPHFALQPTATLSTAQERIEGFADEYLRSVNTDSNDTMIIASISGRNAAVVDMALEAQKMGMKVIALTSNEFSDSVSSRHSSQKKLKDVADVIIDIKCVKGDAVLEMEGMPYKFNGTSTLLAMMVMNMITAQTIENCVREGYVPPVYVSANLDEGDQINAKIIKKYRDRISCL